MSSEYTAPEGLLGELTIIALVFLLILLSSSSNLIWNFSVSADTTTNFAPAAVANTLYSGKNGAIAITSSSGFETSAFRVIVNEAAAPHVI